MCRTQEVAAAELAIASSLKSEGCRVVGDWEQFVFNPQLLHLSQ